MNAVFFLCSLYVQSQTNKSFQNKNKNYNTKDYDAEEQAAHATFSSSRIGFVSSVSGGGYAAANWFWTGKVPSDSSMVEANATSYVMPPNKKTRSCVALVLVLIVVLLFFVVSVLPMIVLYSAVIDEILSPTRYASQVK